MVCGIADASKKLRGQIMFRVLFFILVLMSSFAIAQTEDEPLPDRIREPYKLLEFGKATNGYVKMQFDSYMAELQANPDSRGYIINYGTDREIRIREKQIRDAIAFRKFETTRITLVRGGLCKQFKSEFWIVPAAVVYPEVCASSSDTKPLTPAEAYKLEEFGKVSDRFFKSIFTKFFAIVENGINVKGYILIEGSADDLTALEEKIRSLEVFKKIDSELLVFRKKESNKEQIISLWLVPNGTVLPKKLN
jgi:hypothetical protein